MKINDIDIKDYGGKQLKVDFQPPEKITDYEWTEGAVIPREAKTDIELGSISIEMYFKGISREEVLKNISRFLENFKIESILQLDGFKRKYKGFLTAHKTTKTIRKEYYRLAIDMDGYFFDEKREVTLNNEKEKIIYIEGTRKTPCEIEIRAIRNIQNYKITGISGEDIEIERLEAGETLIINGADGTAKINGENAFSRVNLWEFPILEPGENKVCVTNADAEVKIKFYNMWL